MKVSVWGEKLGARSNSYFVYGTDMLSEEDSNFLVRPCTEHEIKETVSDQPIVLQSTK